MFRMGLIKVISGGQTGADIGGLIAAQFLSYCFMFMGFDRIRLSNEYNFLLPKGW